MSVLCVASRESAPDVIVAEPVEVVGNGEVVEAEDRFP